MAKPAPMLYISAVPPALVLNAILFVLVVAGLVLLAFSVFRGPRLPKSASAREPSAQSSPRKSGATDAGSATVDTNAGGNGALDAAAAMRRLHELALGGPIAEEIPAEHTKTAAAIANTVQAAVGEPRYAPRRPLLLPQLLRALGDDGTSRREIADLVARDPALVGSLLKLANGPLYRIADRPIESVDRAIAVLGTQGVRSLIAVALVQPVFKSDGGELARFPEIVWEHSYRAGAAAETYAASIDADLFTAQLLALVTGLGAIVVFRVAADHYARNQRRPDATAIAAVLDAQTAVVARTIAGTWELSERALDALAEQVPGFAKPPTTPLGRSLHFGLTAGALSVLQQEGVIADDLAAASLTAAGAPRGPRFERLWARLTDGQSRLGGGERSR